MISTTSNAARLALLAIMTGVWAPPNVALADAPDALLMPLNPFPRPNQTFSVRIYEELKAYDAYPDSSPLVNREITLAMPQSFYTAFASAKAYGEIDFNYSVSWSLLGENLSQPGVYQVKVDIQDLGIFNYNSPGGGIIADVIFNGMPDQTSGTLAVADAVYRDPGTGATLPWTLELRQEPILVSDPKVFPDALPDARAHASYDIGLGVPHAHTRVSDWQIAAGSLPPGLTLQTFSGTIIGQADGVAIGSSYNFTVSCAIEAFGTISKTYTLDVVNDGPTLLDAAYIDKDRSRTVTRGDEVLLAFDEGLRLGSGWESQLVPAVVGHTFGTGDTQGQGKPTLRLSSNPRKAVLTLGNNPVLGVNGLLSSDAGVKILASPPAPAAVVDLVGAPAKPTAAGVVFRERIAQLPEPLFVGKSVNLVVHAPPFSPQDVIVLDFDLPPGLTHGTDANGVESISGSFTQADDYLLVLQDSAGDTVYRAFWRVLENPPPGFGIDEAFTLETSYSPGDLLTVPVISPDSQTQVVARIQSTTGTTSLVPFPGTGTTEGLFIIPDNAESGTLLVDQGTDSTSVGPITITPPTAGPDPVIDSVELFVVEDTGLAPHGVLYLGGSSFAAQPGSTLVTLNNVTATLLASGNTYVVAAIPQAVANDPTFAIALDNGNPTSPPAQQQAPNPPDEETPGEGTGQAPSTKVKIKKICDDINSALKVVGNKTENDLRVKLIAIFIALGETQLICNWQDWKNNPPPGPVTGGGGGGAGGAGSGGSGSSKTVAYGWSQIEPKTAADILNSALNSDNQGLKAAGNAAVAAAADAAGVSASAIENEIADILEGDNVWPPNSILCRLLLKWGPFEWILMRLQWRLTSGDVPDITTGGGGGGGVGGDKDKAAEVWAKKWKKKFGSAEKREKEKQKFKKRVCDTADKAEGENGFDKIVNDVVSGA